MIRILPALLAALALLLPGAARADERILHFLSDVTVERDGALTVAETITVRSEGETIKRGILRDFPTRYPGGRGRTMRVGFDVKGVQRDGVDESWTSQAIGNGVRIRIGDPERLIEPGEHRYVIRYRTDRQLGFFENFDELYWNATGTGWTFPIDVAEARIRLPSAVGFGKRAVYTGPEGSQARQAKLVAEQPGDIRFRTTAPLEPGEGLTVAVAWPKGVVAEPSVAERRSWWLRDNGPLGVGIAGLLGVLAYYYVAWRRAGRGPRAGPVVPLFSPPDGLSPAELRYVSKMGFDNRAFAAAIVDLGVRGKIRLCETGGGLFSTQTTTIEKRGEPDGLPAPEAAMMSQLFASGDSIVVDDANHKYFGAARSALEQGLKKAHEGKQFVGNLRWSLTGLGLIVAAMIAAGAALIAAVPGAPMPLAVAVPGLAIGSMLLGILIARSSTRGLSAGRCAVMLAAFALVTASLFAGFLTLVTALDSGRIIPLLIPLLALPVGLSAFWWMPAPTRAGRTAMDRIAGFRHYLSVTEEGRLEAMHPPEKTPALFERYLPHAIALGVENAWASRFAGVLAAAAADGSGGAMSWYSGSGNPWSDAGGFADRIGGTLTSSIASASTAPGSSSGSGGGGSSGGGGGGGGGSGW